MSRIITGAACPNLQLFKHNYPNSRLETRLVSYANAQADVGDHVVFGVDPPVIGLFFLLLSLRFGRIFRINPRFSVHTWRPRTCFETPVLSSSHPSGASLSVGRLWRTWPPLRAVSAESEGRTGGGALTLAPPCCRCTTNLVRLPVMKSDEVPYWS